ncbi:MAG: cadherin domain-containing protein, partial [Methylococcales bacterium]|nr:cadherin domain-containing protein [Methylococcales bacterium]
PSATLTITDVLPNTAPTLGGTFTTAGAVNDNATTTPFSNVTVSDIENNNVSITITYAAANGTLTGAGLTGSAGNYTLTSASLATVQSNLRALVFTPTANQVAVGLTVQTTFTLTPNDGTVNGTPNATTSVTATSINDAPTATNLNTPETYTEDTALNLTDIVISDVDIVSSNVYTAILTLSNTAAGSLSTATSGAVTSTYNAGTGVWSASGSKADVNALLAGVTFNPALNFNGSFNIATSISDGIALAVTGTKALTGIAVNDAPSYISDTVLSISNGVLLSSGDLTTTRPTLEADILWDGTGSGSPFLIYNGNPVSSGYGLIGQILANGTMDVYIVVGGVTVNPVANIAANTWTHIGISLDASGNYQYAVGSTTGAIALPLPNLQDTTVSIANSLTGVFPMNGQVDNVAIWNAALTSTQMASHGLLVGNEANLAGLWKLENNFSNSVAGGQALTASGSTSFIAIPLPQLASIAEDATPSSSGTTIANLILAISVADADHDKLGGLAITGNNANASTQGSWQYYNGTSWTNISVTVSLTNALQLNTSTALRFIPVANYNGTPDSLSAYLIDNSITFTNASLIDLTGLTGGINHYSASTVTLGINVIAVNDAPVGVGNLTLAAVNENTLSPAGAAINSLVGLNFTDVDAGAFLKGVAVVGSGDGNWQYSTNGATNWYSIGTVSLANTLVLAPTTLVRYLPLPNYTGTPPALQVKALDDTYAGSFSSTAGAETRVTLDATVNGGATAIANASNTISTSVTDVNPVIANATASLNENSVAGTTVTTVTASNDTNGLIYSITGGNTDVDGDGNLAFSINASTGAITVNDADDLNFETTPTFSLTVAVDDEDADTTADSTATITVNLQNLDEVAPTITSSATATAINENSGAGQVIYTATSTDVTDYVSGTTAYSLSGTDAALFTINSSTGAVTLTTNPNFEAKASYSFNVVATDAANNASSKAVTLAINNLDEVAPTITSSATATAINENSGAAQVIYTATSTDVTDYVSGTTAYSLSGTDAALFSI